jgi:site-specific DNA-methyltransferase (adenine-specific)
MTTVDLRLGDCIELMAEMPDKSVDAVIMDPPWGVGVKYEGYKDTPENLVKLINVFMPHVLRVAKRALITCGVCNIQRYPQTDWILSWAIPAGVSRGRWGFCCWSPILAYGKDPHNRTRPDTFVYNGRSDKCDHPCPKPTEVMKWIIERGSRPGETILDPFMGSGTTGVACVKTGRNFIGMEICENYFNVAKKRIADEQMHNKIELETV